jgi:hypothetical protein
MFCTRSRKAVDGSIERWTSVRLHACLHLEDRMAEAGSLERRQRQLYEEYFVWSSIEPGAVLG